MGHLTNGEGRFPKPPRWWCGIPTDWLLNRFSPSGLEDELQGDLLEMYAYWVKTLGVRKANWRYTLAVLRLIRPFSWPTTKQSNDYYQPLSNLHPAMLRNYLTIAWRNLLKNKGYSAINIGGLALGMAVAMLIGLWIYDELSFDKYHKNYGRIAQVMQNRTFNGEIRTDMSVPPVLAAEIRNRYGIDHPVRSAGAGPFKYALQASWTGDHILAVGENILTKKGNFFEPQIADMLSLNMLKGARNGLDDPYSILVSESVAKVYFGDTDPLGKLIKIDNKFDVKVTGVYEDLPYNSTFNDLSYILPWALYLIDKPFIKDMKDPWAGNFTQTFVQLADNADLDNVSVKIRHVIANNVSQKDAESNPEVFLQPMSKWHLYADFKNGKTVGGRIEFVWLFGIIGLFVLFLACINFMNLATARSEKRAKEVGIRKAIGSVRGQLISQFFAESLLVVFFAFSLSFLFVVLAMPAFNEIADKKITILWANPIFWLLGIGFSLLTGIVAGSYPALYLSAFQPIKVLKGAVRVGRFASLPRKVLVVIQFTVSITLIIGTIIVFYQIDFAKNRPVGYNRNGLIRMNLSPEVANHFDAVRQELKMVSAIDEMALSGSPLTSVWVSNGGFDWEGKDPSVSVDFPNNAVSQTYGKTVGWTIKKGRDFSAQLATDSTALIINEAAAAFIGFTDPIGKIIKWRDTPFVIIGMVKDLIVESPYAPIRPSIFNLSKEPKNLIILRLNPTLPVQEALSRVETVVKKYNPEKPFSYSFVDEEYAKKFSQEQRIGKLATIFALLAIVISCLGLFGLASFIAEQRTKEIGIRKVLGATVSNLCQLLSKEFVLLVLIACLIAGPLAYFVMNVWLQKYTYRTEISWWIFAASGLGTLLITLLTVSFQSIKAALMDPVKSLRSE